MTKGFAGALAFLAAHTLAGAAFGQQTAATAANARFDQGIAAMEKGDYTTAVQAFREAYAATGSTKLLWDLSLAEIKANHSLDALRHLREYTKRPDASPQNVQRAKGLIERVRKDVGLLAIDAPNGADVFVDGAEVGRAPLPSPVEVDPGAKHIVEARDGTRVAHTDVEPPGAATADVKVVFPAISAAPPSPAPRPAAPAASPTTDDFRTTYDGSSDDPRIPHQTLFLATIGSELAAAAGFAGSGMYVFSKGQPTDQSPGDSSKQVVGGVLMGVGGIFLAGEIATLVFWPRPKPDGGAAIAPTVWDRGGGVSLREKF